MGSSYRYDPAHSSQTVRVRGLVPRVDVVAKVLTRHESAHAVSDEIRACCRYAVRVERVQSVGDNLCEAVAVVGDELSRAFLVVVVPARYGEPGFFEFVPDS